MSSFSKQGDLFPQDSFFISFDNKVQRNLELESDLIYSWQKNIHSYQSNMLSKKPGISVQGSIFNQYKNEPLDFFNPIKLTPLPLNFWQWPQSPHNGPAIYFVMDFPKGVKSQILLYIGETVSADKRWKGDHDCKSYISAYSEALSKARIKSQLSIRFWNDVPKQTKERRSIEQKLIRRWLPPFNKETREHWATPFTSELI